MFEGQKNFHKSFARVSPVFLTLALLVCAAPKPASAAESASASSTDRRQAAEAHYQRALAQREELNGTPVAKRTLSQYKDAVTSFRRVYLITPHSSAVPEALLAVAELYTEMGERYGKSYFQSAVDAFQFLIHQYPSYKSNQEAMLRIAELQRDRLGEASLSARTYQDFLKRYPRSSHKREAQEALAELALLTNGAAPADTAAKTPGPPAEERQAEPAAEREEKTVVAAVHAGGRSVDEDADIPRVRQIKASTTASSTRVVIDLDGTVQYTSSRIKNPDRIFFDLHTAQLVPALGKANFPVVGNLLKAVRVAQNQVGVVRVVFDVSNVSDYTASLLSKPERLVIDFYANEATLRAQSGSRGATVTESSARGPQPKAVLATAAKPDLVRRSTIPQPTRDGQSTLTRALGLKISRIVIDAGHGGHDTGTIGPTGLMEKDLCLDVALRLGKIIKQKLPGADVIFTRSDDTFIPLEERTAIANQAKADLFISIHANSSRDHDARGVETYYLNLKGTPEAMEVAARENAVSQDGIHDLEDVVKKIAQTEKIDESREFAEDIQESLAKRMMRASRGVRNRGVRKAPFVVLIGADMPSILTEISFLSNPRDEKLLKKPDYRQHVAEGIYQGMASYLEDLNSVSLNMPVRRTGHPSGSTASASLEESRNQK